MPPTADSSASLIDLANQKFGQITDAEKTLFAALERQEVAKFQADADELNDPASAEQWGAERTLKADRLVWLVTTPEAVERVGFRGLRVAGAKVEGEFNLDYATVSIPLIFDTCVFGERLKLQSSRLRTLQLKRTHVPGIDANEMRVEDSVSLWDGFVAKGSISLVGAKIDGDLNCINGFEAQGEVILRGTAIGRQLDCSGGKFLNEGRIAIIADAATIAANVFLRYGFKAQGEVNLRGAAIGGQLACNGGKFISAGKRAICAEAATIAASVFLSDDFEAQGEVNLRGAVIGGQLNCSGGKFINAGRIAINADAAKITADVFLRDGFKAQGEVNLGRSSIGGHLLCSEGKFINPGNTALYADAATIVASVFLTDGFEAQGEVNLQGAAIGGQLACSGSKFINAGRTAINANAAKITADVFLRDGFEAQGEVNLCGAAIGGQLDCRGGRFTNAGNTAIQAAGAQISADVFLTDGFEAQGGVNLCGAAIGGTLQCKGRFLNNKGIALSAEGAKIRGSVFLGGTHQSEVFQAEGKMSFLNASIDDRFDLHSMKTDNPESFVLDLRFAKTNIFSFYDEPAEKSWIERIQPGQLCLNGFVYGAINSSNSAIKNQDLLKWLRLQIKAGSASESDDDFALQPYEQLAAILKANGHQEAATQVLIAKEGDRRHHGGLTYWGKALNWFLGATIAHGYRPQRALLYSVVVILLGWGVFAVNKDLMAETNDKHRSYAVFDPLVYSIDTFTPVIDLHQEGTWLPDASKGQDISLLLFKTKQGELLRLYFWFQIVAGWVLTSLWVAGFTGLVRSQR